MAPVPDPIDVRPFLAWVDHRAAQLRIEHGGEDNDAGIVLVVREIGWSEDAGPRRLYDWRHGHDHVRMKSGRRYHDYRPPLAPVSRARVEDALDHAGRALHDVYAEHAERPWTQEIHDLLSELDAPIGPLFDRYCTTCREQVQTGEDVRCPWCEADTLAQRPPRHGTRRVGQGRKLTDEQVLAAHRIYMRLGVGTPELGRMLFEKLGYKNAHTCGEQLRHAFETLNLERRARGRHSPQQLQRKAEQAQRRKSRRRTAPCSASCEDGSRCSHRAKPGLDVCHWHQPHVMAINAQRLRDIKAAAPPLGPMFSAEQMTAARAMHERWGMSMTQIAQTMLADLRINSLDNAARILGREFDLRGWPRKFARCNRAGATERAA
jgi:hypothetical protein